MVLFTLALVLAQPSFAGSFPVRSRLPLGLFAMKDRTVTSTERSPASHAEKVELGRALFFEPKLSRDGSLSCASCHDVVAGGNGAGSTPVALGIDGRRGGRNVPTVWNTALRSALFWDGRAPSLEAQAAGPILNPDEMGMPDGTAVVAVLRADERYRRAFRRVFGTDEPRFDDVLSALAAFERTLVTSPSPVDRFFAGDATALSPRARDGWELFRTIGCLACHGTPTFTTNDVFVKFPHRDAKEAAWLFGFTLDRGRGLVTNEPSDDNRWRVPSLRNVALTAPYFHNGSVASLSQAVRVMARVQLARELSATQVEALVAFLESLTGARPDVRPPLTEPAAEEEAAARARARAAGVVAE